MTNPLLAPWNAHFSIPPFEQIEAAHFKPAFEAALAENRAEINAIADSAESATFENTIAELELSGERLENVARVFFRLAGCNTNDALHTCILSLS